jgi:uncharacterized RmlC-like cupin family protein
MTTPDWRTQGVRIVPGDQLDLNTAQTEGMTRAAAINHARVGAKKLWAGTVTIHPDAKTGAHHHGELESVIYVVRGRARMRWGNELQYVAEAEPGDFILCHPLSPTKRSMPAPTSHFSACLSAPTKKLLSLTWIFLLWNSQRQFIGSILSTRPHEPYNSRSFGNSPHLCDLLNPATLHH